MALGKSPTEIVASGDYPLLEVSPTWERITLGEIASVQNGAPFSSEYFTHGEGMPLIRIRDVSSDTTENFYAGPYDDDFIVEKGELLVGMDGDFRAAIWKGPTGLLNQRVCRIIPKTELYSSEFLFLVLQPYLNAINVETSSITVKHLSSRTISEIPLPLPPLNEQKRIVAKIEELFSELDAGEESLRVARRQLGVYRQSLLKQAFEGRLTAKWRAQNPTKLESPATLLAHIRSARQSRSGPKPKRTDSVGVFPASELVGNFSLPAEWLVVAYSDLCSLIRNGLSQKPSGNTGHKIARISAVRPMIFDYEDYRFIDCDDETAADYTLANGDLVFTRYNGARRFVGVCAQFNGPEPRLYPDKLIRTRPDLPDLDPRYLEIALNCGLSRAWLETKIRTTAGQSGISGGDVKAMPVPICSLPEQHEIVRILDAQFEQIDRNEREIDGALRKSEALRQAILKKAFTGRLVPQIATDEPASALLARVRAERESADGKGSHPVAKPITPPLVPANDLFPEVVSFKPLGKTDLQAGIVALALDRFTRRGQFFGHTIAEKVVHLADHLAEIQLDRHPVKDAAGPNDFKRAKEIEHRARMKGWFTVTPKGRVYDYHTGRNLPALLEATQRTLGAKLVRIEKLLEALRGADTREIEVRATVYAAWNNLLLAHAPASDEAIVTEARENWHSRKLEIPRERFFRAIAWLKQYGFVPRGRGSTVGKPHAASS